jgi:hypothetical protein
VVAELDLEALWGRPNARRRNAESRLRLRLREQQNCGVKRGYWCRTDFGNHCYGVHREAQRTV